MSADGYGYLFGYGIIDYTPTGSADALWPVTNLKEYDDLKLAYRSPSTNATTLTITFSESKTVKAFALDHVNFVSATIAGVPYMAVLDPTTNRYRIVVFPSSLTGSSITIVIPNQATTDGAGYFSIGRFVVTGSKVELSFNPTSRKVKAPYPEPLRHEYADGGSDDIVRGTLKRWEQSFTFERNTRANADSDLWVLDSIPNTDYLIFFENGGDVSKGYVCKKTSSLEIEENTEDNDNIVRVSEHTFREVI